MRNAHNKQTVLLLTVAKWGVPSYFSATSIIHTHYVDYTEELTKEKWAKQALCSQLKPKRSLRKQTQYER